MQGKPRDTAREVAALVEPILLDMGFELVDVEFLPAHRRWVLRLYIDKEDGVTIDDCASVSQELGNLIDVKDLIQHPYVLEVSSPGLNRPLTREKDFLRAVGKKVKVRMVVPIKGRRNYTGCLSRFEEGTLYMKLEEEEVALPWPQVEKPNLIYEFND
jgi:ribosome maturation factor RimP